METQSYFAQDKLVETLAIFCNVRDTKSASTHFANARKATVDSTGAALYRLGTPTASNDAHLARSLRFGEVVLRTFWRAFSRAIALN